MEISQMLLSEKEGQEPRRVGALRRKRNSSPREGLCLLDRPANARPRDPARLLRLWMFSVREKN